MDTIDSVRNFIHNLHNSAFNSNLKEIIQLSGGLVNYVYRLVFENGSTSILKYFPPYLAINKSVQMSQNRYFVEKSALEILGAQPWVPNHPKSIIRTPKLIYHDDTLFVLIMEDAGENVKTLFTCLTLESSSKLDKDFISLFSKELKTFLTYLTDQSNIRQETHQVFKNETGWAILNSYFPTLWSNQAKSLNIEKELEKYIAKSVDIFGGRIDENSVFSFGDLWPNSILIDEDKKLIWIIDWEMARFETRTRDLEQLIANLWVMKQNPNLFDLEKIDFLIKSLQLEYFGDHKSDWRKHCGENAKANFVLWVVGLLNEKHWEIKDNKEAALKAIHEAEI